MASSRLKRPAEEAYTVELNEVPEVVVDGYDWEEENIIVVEDIDVIRLKLGKLIQEYKIHFLNPPRAQKKLLVLDVDHTIFHFQPLAQTAEEQQRPYLHEFLTACYAEYDLMIWSASGMKAVEVKMRFVGVLSDPNYRIAALLDHNAMIVVMTNAGDICCKPLALIWANYPENEREEEEGTGRRKGGRAGAAAGGGGRVVRAGRWQSGEVEVGMEKWDRRGKSGSGDRGGDRWGEVGGSKPDWGGKSLNGGRGGMSEEGVGIEGEVGIGGGKSRSRERWGSMEESRDRGREVGIRRREVAGGTLGWGRKSAKGVRGREFGGGRSAEGGRQREVKLVPPLDQPCHVHLASVCAACTPSASDPVSSPMISEDSTAWSRLEELDPLTREDFAWMPLPSTETLPRPHCNALMADLRSYLHTTVPAPLTDDGVAVVDLRSYLAKIDREYATQRYAETDAPLLYIRIQIGKATCSALIDCGASRNFMSQAFMARAGLGSRVRRKMQPTQVTLADGRTQKSIDRCVDGVPVYFAPLACEPVSFDILDTKFDMILGMSWLRSADHPMNFHDRTVHIRDRNGVLVPCTVATPHTSIACHVVSVARIRDAIARNDVEEMSLVFLHALPWPDGPAASPSDPRISHLLDEYRDVFEAPTGTVPDRPIRHGITLEVGAVPPRGCIYRMSEEELEVLRAQLDDLLDKGWICLSCSPYGAPVIFVRKKNKDLRLCLDYRKLNAQTVKNAGPLPWIDDLLERLGGATYFSKLDLKSGYHQIEIQPQDRYKTAFKTRYGHFEWVVMPFGLTNAPATFQAAMTTEFRDLLDCSVLIYLDDILVYSRTLDEHIVHLRVVLDRLRLAKYKANLDKCEFAKQELEYLGHFVTPKGIRPLADKIQAIVDWPEPRCTTDVRCFMGLAGYYQRFVESYSKVVAPLSRLQSPKLETNLNEKWRQQTAQAEQAAQNAAHQAIQQAAQLAAQQAAELAVRQAIEHAAQAAENLRRMSGFELNGDGRREPNRSTRGKKTTTVENEDTNMEGNDTSDLQLSDTDESDEDLKKIIIKLRKARKAKKNQRKEKGKGPAVPPKQQACKTTTEKGESSRGKRYVPCDDDLRCANDIGAGFGTNDIEVGFGTETGGLRDYSSPRRPAGMRFGTGRTEEDRNVCDEPRTPLTGGYKGLSAKSSTTGLIDYCLAAQKVFSTKKAPALRKICQKKGIKYIKKPEVIDLLASAQVMTAYDGFNEGDRSTAGQSTIRLGETTPATTGGERPGSRDQTPRSAPARLNGDISTEGERRESS
ncbi:hypothetical protein CBR_g37944 [Chara braunii]|uniref:Reverse transcriptase domain-containing protein n=1 Tax=Chara braunii TaxID=69332 RepID=A0A388LP86_CHABU|nr:hypothetical protein CBR_g37944 [Chara braunii]|eukprot:GBG84069.1 hypothetical protein CBR_g37944 [Chara braunii]